MLPVVMVVMMPSHNGVRIRAVPNICAYSIASYYAPWAPREPEPAQRQPFLAAGSKALISALVILFGPIANA